jgi:hypothetical protein
MRIPTRHALIASVVLLLSACPAGAQEPPSAASPEPTDEELIAKGVALRKDGQDAEALAVFERAYALRATPHAVVQMALAHQALAHWREAERGLIAGLHASDDPWVARHRTHLEESLAAIQEHLASLEVESNIAGAELWIGGVLGGHLPLDRPLRVEAGDVIVQVRAPGYALVQQTLHVEAKSQVHVAFTLVSQLAPIASPTGQRSVTDHSGAGRPTFGTRKLAWIALGSAGGFGLVGVAGLVTREWEAQIWNDDTQCAPPPGHSRSDRCGTNRDIGTAAQTIAIAAFAGSAVAAVVSGMLFLGSSRAAAVPTTGVVDCGIGGPGFVCAGAF